MSLKTSQALPLLSKQQLQEFTRLLVTDYGITPAALRQRSGQNLALLARHILDDEIDGRALVVMIGPGHKGHTGLVAAQALLAAGAWLQIMLTDEQAAYPDAAAQLLATVQETGATLAWAEEGWELPPSDLVIDAIDTIDATAAEQTEREAPARLRDLIQLANSSIAPIICADAPAGVQFSDGTVATPHIRATATLIHTLPPATLALESVRTACGSLYLGDVGAPAALYERYGLSKTSLFAEQSLVGFEVRDGRAWLASERPA